MKTAQESEKAFREDFELFLKKHHAEYEITDDGASYGMHHGIVVITIMSDYDWQADAQTREFCEFNL